MPDLLKRPTPLALARQEAQEARQRAFDLEVILSALASNTAVVQRRKRWRVIFRHSPREPQLFDCGKLAVFDKETDTLHFLGGGFEVRQKVQEQRGLLLGSESHASLCDLCELLESLQTAVNRGELTA